MKAYEKPIILENEDMAEGIYAASGEKNFDYDTECWTINAQIEQRNTNPYDPFCRIRIKCEHPTGLQHISSQQTIVLVFNQNITGGMFDEGSFNANGTTVTMVRDRLGDAYNSGDQFNTGMRVVCDDPAALDIVAQTIACTHTVNVQGNFD